MCVLMSFWAKWFKNRFLKKLERSIKEEKINQFFLKRCQKKRNEWGYDFIKEFVAKWSFPRVRCALIIRFLQFWLLITGNYRVRERNRYPLVKFQKTGHYAMLVLLREFSSHQIRRWYIQQSDLVNTMALKQAADNQHFEAKNTNGF